MSTLLYFIATYLTLSTTATRLPASFSNVKYAEIAPYCWLDPGAMGDDIRKLEVFRSRLPMNIFKGIYDIVYMTSLQYGRMQYHNNEEARSRFIASVSEPSNYFPIRLNLTHNLQFYSKIVALFGCAIINNPEGLLEAEFTKKGRIEHHFCSMNSVSIVFHRSQKDLHYG